MNGRRVVLAVSPRSGLGTAVETLESAGYDVARIESRGALDVIAAGERPPDLVILDEAFGEDGGVTACRRLRGNEFWRGVSIMLVVPAGEPHLEEGLVPGINDFILDPFPAEELLEKVARLTVVAARRELNTLVRVRDVGRGGVTLLGKTLNVSLNGLLVEMEGRLAVGRDVELEFFLPDDPEPLRVRGRVIRRALELDLYHPAFGIRFNEMPGHDRSRIDEFIAKREQAGLMQVLPGSVTE